jgi:hypothetical protein
MSPFQPAKENWNAVTFLNQAASRPRGPDAGGSRKSSFLFAWNGLIPLTFQINAPPPCYNSLSFLARPLTPTCISLQVVKKWTNWRARRPRCIQR